MSSIDMIRVGFIGASEIAHKTWSAISAAGHFRVTIVGSRSSAKAQSFIDECVHTLHLSPEDTPIVGSYEDVVSSNNVDVVYISIPVTERGKWIMECAAHHKHVVGEKPCARDVDELQTWIHALSQHQLLYMDDTMFSHGPVLQRVLHELPSIGELRHIYSTLCFRGDDHFMQHDIRVNPALEPHGALGDVGWYCIRAILHLMSFQMPSHVRGQILQRHPSSNAILAFSGEMVFANKSHDDSNASDKGVVSTHFYCSFTSGNEEQLIISGSKAVLCVPNLTNPLTESGAAKFVKKQNGFVLDGTATNVNDVATEICVKDETGHTQEVHMWRDVYECLVTYKDNKNDDDDGDKVVGVHTKLCKKHEMEHYAHMSLITQRVMDMLMASLEEEEQ